MHEYELIEGYITDKKRKEISKIVIKANSAIIISFLLERNLLNSNQIDIWKKKGKNYSEKDIEFKLPEDTTSSLLLSDIDIEKWKK